LFSICANSIFLFAQILFFMCTSGFFIFTLVFDG
jgi:hypothetical protein